MTITVIRESAGEIYGRVFDVAPVGGLRAARCPNRCLGAFSLSNTNTARRTNRFFEARGISRRWEWRFLAVAREGGARNSRIETVIP